MPYALDTAKLLPSSFIVHCKRVTDTDPDLSYLTDTADNYKGEAPEDIAKYVAQDRERVEAYNHGVWEMIAVHVEVWRNGCKLGMASLHGIESDSGEDYFKQVEKELREEAIAQATATLAQMVENLPLNRTPAVPYTVTLEVTDLWRDGSSWTGNYCWRREYTASAPTRKGAIRKVLAMSGYKGWRLNYWANSRESWKLDGACIGAYIMERT